MNTSHDLNDIVEILVERITDIQKIFEDRNIIPMGKEKVTKKMQEDLSAGRPVLG